MTYYLTAELIGAVYSWTFIKGWGVFSCLSPILAYLTWLTKEKGLFPKIISIGIIFVTIVGNFILQGNFIIPDFIIIPLIAYILFLKKIKRNKSEYKEK